MILLTGATGMLGARLLPLLSARSDPVRVLVRDPGRLPSGTAVEAVVGGIEDPRVRRTAVAGTRTVVSLVNGLLSQRRGDLLAIDRDANAALVDDANRAGARVVMLSVVGAHPESALELSRIKHAAETYLLEHDPRGTVIRATPFLDTLVTAIRETRRATGRPLVFGHGNNPAPLVAVDDVARLVILALDEPSLAGERVEITGPERITMDSLARLVQRADGRAEKPRHVPRGVLRLLAAQRLRPREANLAALSLYLDTADMAYAGVDVRERFPQLPATRAATLLGARERHPLG